MSSSFKVVLVGFSALETTKIEKIMNLTHSHTMKFFPQREIDAGKFDIVMVDADDSVALARAEALAHTVDDSFLILITSKPELMSRSNIIRKPIISTRFVASLNELLASNTNSRMFTESKPIPNVNSTVSLETEPEETLPFRVLVVDDSQFMRSALEIELEKLTQHIEITLVSCGEEALEKIAGGHCFDLIFLDIMMTGIDGNMTCQAIRKNELFKKTPVVMLSAKTSAFDEMRAYISGCTDYLTKPIEHDAFAKVLQRVCGNIPRRLNQP